MLTASQVNILVVDDLPANLLALSGIPPVLSHGMVFAVLLITFRVTLTPLTALKRAGIRHGYCNPDITPTPFGNIVNIPPFRFPGGQTARLKCFGP
jgi:hypothetical protein